MTGGGGGEGAYTTGGAGAYTAGGGGGAATIGGATAAPDRDAAPNKIVPSAANAPNARAASVDEPAHAMVGNSSIASIAKAITRFIALLLEASRLGRLLTVRRRPGGYSFTG